MTRALPLSTAALVLGLAAPARAQDAARPEAPDTAPPTACRLAAPDGSESATCFDPGNRLYVGGGLHGGEVGIQRRGQATTDDPGTTWRVEHGLLRGAFGPGAWRAQLYEGRYMRHSREGYLLLPGNPPRRLSVPFDVGFESTVGRFEGKPGDSEMRGSVVRGALLADLSRSETFRRRLALGVVGRWDVVADRERRAVTEHAVSPFTVGLLGLYAESEDGLTLGSVSGELGAATLPGRGGGGWRRHLLIEATIERVLVSFNDRPLSLYLGGRYDEQSGRGLQGEVGLRLALLTRRRE